jgi:hypothetical protein
MVTTKQKPIVDPCNIKRVKYGSREYNLITREDNLTRKKHRIYRTTRKQQNGSGEPLPFNNYLEYKWLTFYNQKISNSQMDKKKTINKIQYHAALPLRTHPD